MYSDPVKRVKKISNESDYFRWSEWSLQLQLAVVVTIISLIVTIGITSVFVFGQNQRLRSQLEELALTMLISVDAATIDEIYFADVDQIETIATNFTTSTGILVVRIYDEDGRLLVASDDITLGASLNADPLGVKLLAADDPQFEWSSERLIAGKSITVGQQVIGAVHIELSTVELNNQLQLGLIQGFIATILASLFGIAAVILVTRSLTSPMATLVQDTRSIATGDFTKPITVHGGSTEIIELVHTIEDMRINLKSIYAELEQRVANRTAALKTARDEAVAAQELASENSRLKSEFLSTMSHELRTPLNAIEGFTSIMLGGMGIELSPRAEDMVERISSNSKRLLHLINDFLDLSRIESGRLDLVKEPLSIAKLARKWKSEVGVLAEKKGIEFVTTIDSNLPEFILADEDALSKIVINLLGNAFKFTHEGQVLLDLSRDSETLKIKVSDTGIGIPLHAQEYIFDEFRQVDGSSKRLYGGTGLGLALVQKLVRAMNGNILLESEVDKGSTFQITLPLEQLKEK